MVHQRCGGLFFDSSKTGTRGMVRALPHSVGDAVDAARHTTVHECYNTREAHPHMFSWYVHPPRHKCAVGDCFDISKTGMRGMVRALPH